VSASYGATVVQNKTNDDREIIYDYNRDENGKRLEGDAGKEKYVQTETIEKTFDTELELAEFVRNWSREQTSDRVTANLDSEISYSGDVAIRWAQRVCDIAEQQARVLDAPKIVEIKGKKYLEIKDE